MKTELKSRCDDDHFMSGEIILTHDDSRKIEGITMELDLQASQPAFLRREEIRELIDNLTSLYFKLEYDDEN